MPAGGDASGRDFAFRKVTGTGQSTNSSISGRVYDDANGNEIFDAGDRARGGVKVFLDDNNNGVHDLGTDEPIVVTDANGVYSFTGLGGRIAPVRAVLDETIVTTSPLGNSFQKSTFQLFTNSLGFTDPCDLVTDNFNFNVDDHPDLAALIIDNNSLAIRLNDGNGQFPASTLDISLSPGVNLDGLSRSGRYGRRTVQWGGNRERCCRRRFRQQ